MTSHTRRFLVPYLLLGCALGIPTAVEGQAFCALRDPERIVFEIFPDANAYRSIVRRVDDRARQAVADLLPFELHFKELGGHHTLYAVLDDARPIGLIHSRSETGRWGLNEIVWAFDLDLRVVDFRFQRCRDPACDLLAHPAFRRQIHGMGQDELRALFGTGETLVTPSAIDVQPEALAFATSLLRSALKTIVVTETGWARELHELGR